MDNPEKCTSMKFLIEYATKDIFDSIPYVEYVERFPYLRHLKLSSSDATKFINDMNKEDINNVKPGDTVYVDIAWYG